MKTFINRKTETIEEVIIKSINDLLRDEDSIKKCNLQKMAKSSMLDSKKTYPRSKKMYYINENAFLISGVKLSHM